MNAIRRIILSGVTLLCLHLLGEQEKAKQVIDMGVEYETAHLKFSGSVTNSLGKIFELTTIEKSCDCLGTVQVLNKNRAIPEGGVNQRQHIGQRRATKSSTAAARKRRRQRASRLALRHRRFCRP